MAANQGPHVLFLHAKQDRPRFAHFSDAIWSHVGTAEPMAGALQVDLSSSAIRPGKDEAWLNALKERIFLSLEESEASVTVHVGNWQHDLDQVPCASPRI
jgi:hypothetical protein